MSASEFKSNLTMTHIGTACAILEIEGVNLLTDPVFAPAGTEYDLGNYVMKQIQGPALKLEELPPIDAVLLSHEDHLDNLDPLGRQLLDGRKVVTTMDGAKNLQPRPGVRGIRPWETLTLEAGGKQFRLTGTPCQHLPGGEVTGFIIESPTFGTSADGKPNVIFWTGDTVYIEELLQIRDKYHVSVLIMNLGKAEATLPDIGLVHLTMGGKDGAKLARELAADVVVPVHFDEWKHFTEFGEELRKVFEQEGIADRVCWLTPGVPKRVI